MKPPTLAVFYDFHTMPACPDVGRDFDPEAVAARLERCGVDFTAIAARCNNGMAYYNTKTGIRHPSLKRDLIREFGEACHRHGIRLSAYMNVGLSHEEARRHPEWAVLFPDGRSWREPHEDSFFRQMCYNSGYAEHLLEMIGELLEYPIDGFFFDCFVDHECICGKCTDEARSLGMTTKEFGTFARHRLMTRMAEKIKSSGRDYLLYFNGIPFREQLEYATYLEFECLPTGGWGYDSLPANARFIRNLGLPVLNMSGRFHKSWGDFGGIRSHEALLADGVLGFANGMGFNTGDHFHPRGDMNEPVYRLIEGVYAELKKLLPLRRDAVPETEAAVLTPPWTFDYTSASGKSVLGTHGFTRMLGELKIQFDILLSDMPFDKYKLVILSDDLRMDSALAEKLRKYLAAGGKVISTGRSGLNPEGTAFELGDLWPAEYLGESKHDPEYFRLKKTLPDFPDMPVATYEGGISMKAKPGMSEAVTIAPFFNRGFRDGHAWMYLPPDGPDGTDYLAWNDSVAQFSHPLGLAYYESAQIPVRTLLKHVIDRYLPSKIVECEGLPSFARAIVSKRGSDRFVWLTAWVPERRGSTVDMIEEGIFIDHAKIALKTSSVRKATAYPSGEPVKFRMENGRCVAEIPAFRGYCVIAFEGTEA